VRVSLDGGAQRVIEVDGTPRSYELATDVGDGQHVATLVVEPGVEVYSFTFG
jgi:hypothetical protein